MELVLYCVLSLMSIIISLLLSRALQLILAWKINILSQKWAIFSQVLGQRTFDLWHETRPEG